MKNLRTGLRLIAGGLAVAGALGAAAVPAQAATYDFCTAGVCVVVTDSGWDVSGKGSGLSHVYKESLYNSSAASVNHTFKMRAGRRVAVEAAGVTMGGKVDKAKLEKRLGFTLEHVVTTTQPHALTARVSAKRTGTFTCWGVYDRFTVEAFEGAKKIDTRYVYLPHPDSADCQLYES